MLLEEIEKAQQFNYKVLFNQIKEQVIEDNKDQIELFMLMLNGSIDEMTRDRIQALKDNKIVDEMNIMVN